MASIRKTCFSPYFLVMLLLLLANAASASEMFVPGVAAGDSARYGSHVTYEGNRTLLLEVFSGAPYPGNSGSKFLSPIPTLDYANVMTLALNITRVLGTDVSMNIDNYYTNGTIQRQNVTSDIANQDLFGAMVIAKGLSRLDRLSPTPDSTTLNDTESSMVLGITRAVNSVNVNFDTTNFFNGDIVRKHEINAWDQMTGILVSSSVDLTVTRNTSSYQSSGTILANLQMSSTSLWSSPTSFLGLQPIVLYGLVGLVLVAVLTTIGFLFRKTQSRRIATNSIALFVA